MVMPNAAKKLSTISTPLGVCSTHNAMVMLLPSKLGPDIVVQAIHDRAYIHGQPAERAEFDSTRPCLSADLNLFFVMTLCLSLETGIMTCVNLISGNASERRDIPPGICVEHATGPRRSQDYLVEFTRLSGLPL
jgi:hypothetical protein